MTEQSAALSNVPAMFDAAASNDLDPSDIFSMMVVSSAFDPRSASIEEKRQIFGRVWANDVPWLRSEFDSAGKNSKTETFGFGFLVEAFVRHSSRLPFRNTEKGETAAREILSELHLGKRGNIQLGSKQSNSDFLKVKLSGRRITITSLAEIKSSYEAAKDKIGGQLRRQETSLNYLADQLEVAKVNGSVLGYFQKRGIVVADNLDKFLIVPFGEGEEARRDKKFSDWQIVEIEYGYLELIFIAQQIWPDFRPDIKIGPGKLASLDQIAIRLGKHIFGDLDGPFFELGLFMLATGKTPSTENEVALAVDLTGKSFWPAVQRRLNSLKNNATSCPDLDFSDREKKLFKKFWYVLTSSREDLEQFLYFIRSLNAQIKELACNRCQTKQLKAMSEAFEVI